MPALLKRALALMPAALLVQTIPSPPPTPAEPLVDEYHGTKVTDPYRWMEERSSPRFVQWLKDQDAYARAMIGRIPGRDALLQRIAAKTAGQPAIWDVRQAEDRLFYQKRAAGEETYKLYWRPLRGGGERLIVDPDARAASGQHNTIDYYEPSHDGRSIIYAISPAGTERSVIHIVDVASGREAKETIDRVEYGFPVWHPSGKAFFYNRLREVGPQAAETERYNHSRVYLHRIGTDPSEDVPIIGTGLKGSPSLGASDYPYIETSPGSRWALGFISYGPGSSKTIYIAPVEAVTGSQVPWRKVADPSDGVKAVAVHGDTLDLRTNKGAPRGKIIAVDAKAPDMAKARVIVPPGERVVQRMAAASNALYVADLDGGVGRLRRYDYRTGKLVDVRLPMEGTLRGPAVTPTSPAVIVGMENWVRPGAWYRLGGTEPTFLDLVPRWQGDSSAFVIERLKARSWDGTEIPVSVVRRRDLKLDGRNPILMRVYGAYGNAQMPIFTPQLFPLLEDGGIYAVAHVRGGGEYGEEWHLGGKIATKPNSHKDLIASAEHLIAKGYGSPSTLAVRGHSAGGIAVGMAMIERPDLFRVVVSQEGDNNTLRTETATNGPANAVEYGSVKTETGFRALYAVDATQHVRKGVPYPAVLLTTGFNDARVPPWQPGKFTGHLQAASTGGRPVILRVNWEGGHEAVSKSQLDEETADLLAFFYWQIGKPGYQPKGEGAAWAR